MTNIQGQRLQPEAHCVCVLHVNLNTSHQTPLLPLSSYKLHVLTRKKWFRQAELFLILLTSWKKDLKT